MSSGGGGANIFGAYAVVKSREPKPGERVDVQADQAALDEEELQELEGDLYGDGAGPAHGEEAASEARHGHHLPKPHLPGRG